MRPLAPFVPPMVELELTSACNAECGFCPRHLFKKTDLMKRDVFAQVVARLAEAGIPRVKLVGIGEPTLHPDLLWAMRLLRHAGVAPVLNTNGTRLHKLDVDEILELADEVILSLHTLDRDVHRQIFQIDAFDDVVRNLDDLLERNRRFGRQITTYVVVTALNPTAIADISARYGDRVSVRPSGCTNRALPGFNAELVDLGAHDAYNHYPTHDLGQALCGFATSSVAISARGRYLVCTNDVTRDTLDDDVFAVSIEEHVARLRKGLGEGAYMSLCGTCDNFAPYRAELERGRLHLPVVRQVG